MMSNDLHVSVLYRDQVLKFVLSASETLAGLGEMLQSNIPGIDPKTMKLICKGKVLRLNDPTRNVAECGIRSGTKLKLLASSKSGVQAVEEAEDLPVVASFEHEERRERMRQAPSDPSTCLPSGPYTFETCEPWTLPGLQPPPSEALKILHKLVSDPGIVSVMRRHKWRVGLLSEMPPEGKVGISPVCILGANMNHGQEITLRLRTDDLKGFRKYDRIRETLIHELAHMVYGEHDNNFKELNSRLRREVEAGDWKGAAGARTVSGVRPGSLYAPTLSGSEGYASQKLPCTGGIGRSLRELGNGGGTGQAATTPARSAGEAALRRWRESEIKSHPLTLSPSPSPPRALPLSPAEEEEEVGAWLPKKGDMVLYRSREGMWIEAKVVAVDVSVMPPSYGIELPGEDGMPNYRETEADRLKPRRRGKEEIEGLDHYDEATEAKEARIRRLES